jgi:nucleoside-diphosphate-sugar epimerase
LDGTINLIDLAVKYNINRFIFASTCSNYGKMKTGSNEVDETSPLSPLSLYAETKVEVEKYLLNRLSVKPGFCPTCLRFATVYGMSPRMRFDLTVNEFTKEFAAGRELEVFGEQFWRPYCYVGDFSKAIIAVLSAPEKLVGHNVFNVGDTTENYTKKMLVDSLLKLVPQGQVKYVPRREDPRDYRVNFSKIKKMLNFKISKTVPQGMADILGSIKNGIIENPEDQRYYNIPFDSD